MKILITSLLVSILSSCPTFAQQITYWHNPNDGSISYPDGEWPIAIAHHPEYIRLWSQWGTQGGGVLVIPVTLPSTVEIDSITVCYSRQSAFIQETRLIVSTDPSLGDHGYFANSDDQMEPSGCYSLDTPAIPVSGAAAILLFIRFPQSGSYNDWGIHIGAIGVTVTSGGAAGIGAHPTPPLEDGAPDLFRPNPFNPSATIVFSVPREGTVALQVYDASGRLVRTLVDGKMEAGEQSVTWNGLDNSGQALSSGTYFYSLSLDGQVLGKGKAVILK
jgi:hypothetical protein